MRYSARFWSKFYKIRYYQSISAEQTNREVKFLEKFLPPKKYVKILDFICGPGRHSLSLAKNRRRVEGFDADKASIKEAAVKARSLKLNTVKFYVKNALSFRKRHVFDASICLYSSIGFLNHNSNRKIFDNLFKSVKPEGRLIIDLMNPLWAQKHLTSLTEKEISYRGNIYKIRHRRMILKNPTRERNIMDFLNLDSGRRERSVYSLRLYSLKEIRIMLKKYNFKIKKEFGSFRGNSISSNQQRMIIVADNKKI